jgi:hypothetical protein
MDVSVVSFTPGRFTTRETAPGTYWIGGWVGSRASLDAVIEKFAAPAGTRTLEHPLRSPALYRWAIQAPFLKYGLLFS